MVKIPLHIGFKASKLTLALHAAVSVAIFNYNNLTAQETPPAAEAQCLETDHIKSYKIETDDLIRFTMTNGDNMIMRLKSYCPQLRFHGYFSYTPMNGRLCAGADEIKTRSGLPCIIGSLVPETTSGAQQSTNR